MTPALLAHYKTHGYIMQRFANTNLWFEQYEPTWDDECEYKEDV